MENGGISIGINSISGEIYTFHSLHIYYEKCKDKYNGVFMRLKRI